MSTSGLLLSLIMIAIIFSLCNPIETEATPSPVSTQQPSAFFTVISEESIIATEQAKASIVKTAGALTRVAQPTFTPLPTLTPTSEHLATLTPIPNSTPAEAGAFFNVAADVLGLQYDIESACYFDTQSGWERYEIYSGALAGSGDEYTSQGVVIVRKFQAVEQVRTPLNFGWFLYPASGALDPDNHSVPLARLEIDGRMQLGYLGEDHASWSYDAPGRGLIDLGNCL